MHEDLFLIVLLFTFFTNLGDFEVDAALGEIRVSNILDSEIINRYRHINVYNSMVTVYFMENFTIDIGMSVNSSKIVVFSI